MDIASSIYWGGQIVEAKDKRLNYFSYKELGLICPACGEEIHLRKGQVKKPHFAHFQSTEVSRDCKLRVKNYSTYFKNEWQNSTHSKNQRRKLFQKHLLKLVVNDTPVDNSLSFDSHLFTNLLSELKSEKHKIIKYLFTTKDKRNDNFILECQIILEIIDYLTLDTSYSLLEKIVRYIIYLKKSSSVSFVDILNLLINIDWSQKLEIPFKNTSSTQRGKTARKPKLSQSVITNNGLSGLIPYESNFYRLYASQAGLVDLYIDNGKDMYEPINRAKVATIGSFGVTPKTELRWRVLVYESTPLGGIDNRQVARWLTKNHYRLDRKQFALKFPFLTILEWSNTRIRVTRDREDLTKHAIFVLQTNEVEILTFQPSKQIGEDPALTEFFQSHAYQWISKLKKEQLGYDLRISEKVQCINTNTGQLQRKQVKKIARELVYRLSLLGVGQLTQKIDLPHNLKLCFLDDTPVDKEYLESIAEEIAINGSRTSEGLLNLTNWQDCHNSNGDLDLISYLYKVLRLLKHDHGIELEFTNIWSCKDGQTPLVLNSTSIHPNVYGWLNDIYDLLKEYNLLQVNLATAVNALSNLENKQAKLALKNLPKEWVNYLDDDISDFLKR